MNTQSFKILVEALNRYSNAEGAIFTNDDMPQQPVGEMLADAITAALKVDKQDLSVGVPGKVPRAVEFFGGHLWMRFQYNPGEDWPKIMKYQDRKYKWIYYDYDNMWVTYKEIKDSDIAHRR